tara:strand:- start:7561 stop:7974 length:414 start_codon:yes stop_codon:yes gene_type:complete
MINQLVTSFLLIIFVISFTPSQINATTNELPECVVITHCVRENIKVRDLEKAFKKATRIISETPRTKIVERTNSYIHAEAKTKWRRYTDDLLVKAIPDKEIIQVRSESRVGIGDNGVNQRRVDDFAYRLMTESDVSS